MLKIRQMFKTLLLILTLFFSSLLLHSQGYLVHHYTETDGLPTANVHDITQDPLGRMWFATRGGIAVYDGVSWEKYTVDTGLPLMPFYKIAADRQGKVWALSFNSSGFIMVVQDIHSRQEQPTWQTFKGDTRYKLDFRTFNWLNLSSFQLLESNSGDKTADPVIAVGTTTQGLFLWQQGRWKNVNETHGLPSDFVNGIVPLEGKLYVATAKGLSVIRVRHNLEIEVDNRLNELLTLPTRETKAIAVQYKDQYPESRLKHSRVWLYGHGWLGYFQENNPKMTLYPEDILLTERNQMVRLLPDYRCGLYVANRVGINYFNYNNLSWEPIRVSSGLISDGANSMFIDFEKNIWITCDRGVSKISSRRFSNLQTKHGLLDDEVSAILEYEPGKFVLGHNNGFTFYDGKNFTRIPLYQRVESQQLLIRVLDMQLDSQGNIWAAMSWGGLAKVNPRPPHTISWYGNAHGLPPQVNTLWITKDNRNEEQIWVGSEQGLFVKSKRSKQQFVSRKMGISPPPWIRKLFGTHGQFRYIATNNEGIYVYKEKEDSWKNYYVPGNRKANDVYAAARDSQGRLLIGSLAGLFILENETLKKFKSNDFQLDRPVYFIREDEKNRLWFGTNNGVVRWDGKEIKKYSTAEGLVGLETNRAAGIVDSRGRVWIGTNRGVSIYDEAFDENDSHLLPPKIQLVYLKTPNQQIPLQHDEPVRLVYKENTIGFYFRGISFFDEKAIRFKHQLEGFEKEWSTEQYHYNQIIRYTNLPPGSYRFHLKARNARGVWSSAITSPSIIILKPFHQTWWFYLLVVLAIAVVLYSILQFLLEKRNAALLAKQVEERTRQLQAVEKRYQRLFEESKDMVFISTPEGKALDVNPAGVELFGFQSREEALRVNSILDFYNHPEARAVLMEEFADKGYVKDYEVNFKRKDGETITLLLTATVERDEAGKITAYRGIARDITEKKRLEEQLIQARKMEAIGTLAGGIAHDFNNILAVIMGQGELIHDEMKEGVEKIEGPQLDWIRKSANHIVNAADRGAELVKQILTFSRQSRQERKPIDLTGIIKDSLSLLRSILPATIEIRQKIQSDCSSILADSTQMRQVMLNFGTNAAHAMRDKGGVLEVTLEEVYLDEESIKQYNDLNTGIYLGLTVSDTGHGMSPEVMKRIFDPYFTTKKTGEGTGMGLAVIHGIIKSHGGDISVQSKPGKGTTFRTFLPCLGEKEKPAKIQLTGEVPGGNEQILLVDDEDRLVEAIGQLLKRLGYQVTGVSNPLEALTIFRENPGRFDLIISDVTMPRLTGTQLAKKIRHISPDIPIILCSGFKSTFTSGQLQALGISHFLLKPINRTNLAMVIRDALDSRVRE